MRYFTFLIFIIFSVHSFANEFSTQDALAAEKAGDHKKAINIFSNLADKGDSRAMIHLGIKYYSGDGVVVNYEKSMDWWLKAFKVQNGDALGNIGVLFRDGKGVKENRKIAYLLFLFTHMTGLGTDSTQMRVNANLRREISELSQPEIEEALCYTMEYVFAYVESRGKLKSPPNNALPKNGAIRIKDNNWWLESERKDLKFKCNVPWEKS